MYEYMYVCIEKGCCLAVHALHTFTSLDEKFESVIISVAFFCSFFFAAISFLFCFLNRVIMIMIWKKFFLPFRFHVFKYVVDARARPSRPVPSRPLLMSCVFGQLNSSHLL